MGGKMDTTHTAQCHPPGFAESQQICTTDGANAADCVEQATVTMQKRFLVYSTLLSIFFHVTTIVLGILYRNVLDQCSGGEK